MKLAKKAFDDEGKCLKYGSRVSFADATDTIVFVDDEGIVNRNCVRRG